MLGFNATGFPYGELADSLDAFSGSLDWAVLLIQEFTDSFKLNTTNVCHGHRIIKPLVTSKGKRVPAIVVNATYKYNIVGVPLFFDGILAVQLRTVK